MKNLPSFSFVPVVLIVIVVFLLGPVISKQVVYGLLTLLIIAIFYEAFSQSQFEQMRKTYPEMSRRFWIINILIYHLLVPTVFLSIALLGYYFL